VVGESRSGGPKREEIKKFQVFEKLDVLLEEWMPLLKLGSLKWRSKK
jgi:hypothetical protein